MTIPPCTTGRHSTVDDTPVEAPKATAPVDETAATPSLPPPAPRVPIAQPTPTQAPQASTTEGEANDEEEEDDPNTPIPANATCKRKSCNKSHNNEATRSDQEICQHHSGVPIFHEGSKGWTCCKRRVLDFDEFLVIPGCKTKHRHLFVGKKKDETKEEELNTIRHDFYQTPEKVLASLYLKKIDKASSTVKFTEKSVELDLHTTDRKSFVQLWPLFAAIDAGKSEFSVMGTKLELRLAKADGASWPVLREDEKHSGEIIQVGRAGRV
jgi:hypothetical protein